MPSDDTLRAGQPAPAYSSRIDDRCPGCGEEAKPADRYLSPDLNPAVPDQCSTGLPPLFFCKSCGKSRALPLPAIYDDPAHRLLTFICMEDSETLIHEFHDLLESCREVMGESRYDQAWRRPFQITIGWAGFSRILNAVRNESVSPVMRLWPKLKGFVYENMFLRAAQANDIAGHGERAFEIIVRSATYPIYSADTLRTLSEEANERGLHSHARALAQAADSAATRSPHIWEKIMVSEGAVTTIPEDIQLPKMEANLRYAYDLIRPDGYLWSDLEAEVCGLAVGYLERVVQEAGETFALGVNLTQARSEINDLLSEAAESDRQRLLDLFTNARNEVKAIP